MALGDAHPFLALYPLMRYRRNNTNGIGSEAELQQLLCDYLRLQHPSVIFRSDVASGLKLTIGQAARHKRLQSGRAFPDLFIYHPRHDKHGLALELKRPGSRLYKKDGSLVSDPHIAEQAAMLDRLQALGYEAHFTQSFDHARYLIDSYLEDETAPLLEF